MTQVVLLHNCKLSNNWLKIMSAGPLAQSCTGAVSIVYRGKCQ